jgi:8-oxo-dGTP pyrophosphatase MutT (NUDIX family)
VTLLAEKTIPKESATVILVRQDQGRSWEIFLARRHKHQSFMAGAYVFPGGQVDAADGDSEISPFISATDNFDPLALLQDKSLTPETARSLFICAIRETFEETGVLIAWKSGESENCIKLNQEPDISRFAAYRKELNSGRMTLREIAKKESLFFPLNTLLPYAHWITPEIQPKRFSTRFFLARLPEGQTATTDSDELTDFIWVTPGNALQMNINSKIMLMPPTLKTLEELSAFSSLDTLFADVQGRTIYPILPQHSENILKLPHDPEYSVEGYKKPARPAEPSRFTFSDGIWRTGFLRNNTR